MQLDRSALSQRYTTYQRFFGFVSGWDVSSVRLATDAHDSGSFGLTGLLQVVITRYHGVAGPLDQRLAPPLTRHAEITGGERGVARVAREEFEDVIEHRVRPHFPDIFEDHAMMGMNVLHHPWVLNEETGCLVPDVRVWPMIGVRFNWVSQKYEAFTAERGLVPIEGPTWSIVGRGRLPHLRGAIRRLGDPWAQARYGERDEAALSAYLGRKVPIGICPSGIAPSDKEGIEIGDSVRTLGMARSGGLFPFGTEIKTVDNIDAGTAQLLEGLMQRRLSALATSLLGTDGTVSKGSPGVYTSPLFGNVARHTVRRDATSSGLAFTRLGRLFTAINYPQLAAKDSPGYRWLLPDPEEQERLDAEAKRAIDFGKVIKGWRDAGLDPEEEHIDRLAERLRTVSVPPLDVPPPPDESEGQAREREQGGLAPDASSAGPAEKAA